MLAMLTNHRCLLLPPSEDDLEVQPLFIFTLFFFYFFGFALQEIPTPLRGTAKSMPFFHCQKWNVRTILRGESNFFSGVANHWHLASLLLYWCSGKSRSPSSLAFRSPWEAASLKEFSCQPGSNVYYHGSPRALPGSGRIPWAIIQKSSRDL